MVRELRLGDLRRYVGTCKPGSWKSVARAVSSWPPRPLSLSAQREDVGVGVIECLRLRTPRGGRPPSLSGPAVVAGTIGC